MTLKATGENIFQKGKSPNPQNIKGNKENEWVPSSDN